MEKNATKNKSYLDAWNNAIYGVIYTTKTQINFKIQLIITACVLILSLFFDLTKTEFLCLTISIMIVLVTEVMNTAIESVVDLIINVYHPKAKIAKDVAAGGVVIASINSVIVAYFLFFEKITEAGSSVLYSLTKSPMHLAVVSIALTVVGVVALKSFFNKGTPLRGGMPSRTCCNIICSINCNMVKLEQYNNIHTCFNKFYISCRK